MRWLRKKTNGNGDVQQCFAMNLRDLTVAEYNEERRRHRTFWEAFHGSMDRPPMFKILCGKCGNPVELTAEYDMTTTPATRQTVCPHCHLSDYILP